MTTPTLVEHFLNEIDAGTFGDKLGIALSDVAASVVDHEKPGKVVVEFTMKRAGSGAAVTVGHKLSYTRPTRYGKTGEEETKETLMHVGRGGRLTMVPENQSRLFEDDETK